MPFLSPNQQCHSTEGKTLNEKEKINEAVSDPTFTWKMAVKTGAPVCDIIKSNFWSLI